MGTTYVYMIRNPNLRRGPVFFLSAGGGGNVKFSHGLPGRRVYPVKYAGGGGDVAIIFPR